MKKTVFILLTLTLLVVLSACSSGGIVGDQEEIFEGATLKDVVEVQSNDPNQVEIKNTSDKFTVSIRRNFLTKEEDVIELPPQTSYSDQVPYDGSTYTYTGYIGSKKLEGNKEVVTEVSANTRERSLLYDWDDYFNEVRPNGSEVFNTLEGSAIYSEKIHGVKISVIYRPEAKKQLSDSFMQEYLDTILLNFHREWTLYGGFPVNECKYVVGTSEELHEETVFGNYTSVSFLEITNADDRVDDNLFEPVSHVIAHMWIAASDTEPVSRDKFESTWIIEGFARYNGVLTIDNTISMLEGSYNDDEYKAYEDMPLVNMYEELFGTEYASAYYAKGSFLIYKISERLEENTSKEYSDFLYYLYGEYLNNGGNSIKLDAAAFQNHLENFSGISYESLFNKYVYGTEVISIDNFEEKYMPQWDY